MVDIESLESADHVPKYFSKLSSNLFNTEKSLIKLREGLPMEKQGEYTKRIQELSGSRNAFINTVKTQKPFNADDSNSKISELQERFNECLEQMVGEIVEEAESIEYKESEHIASALRRRRGSTKGMIVGNFTEATDTMDRILAVGENLIVQGYQKLYIDSASMKDKLQLVIDERQNLPSCSKPLDTFIVKLHFCEKQLNCMLMLLEQSNTLTDLITKLQEFNKRQIQLQQVSQVTIEAMKKFFYRTETRKGNERKKTYLNINYADPSNPREGLDILRDQINSVVRNLNSLCDMEDLKVRTVKTSDFGGECERSYDSAKSTFEEEKEITKKTLTILLGIEDNQIELDRSDKFLEDFKLPEEVPQSQLDHIKYFVQCGLSSPEIRLRQAKLFFDLVHRFDQDHSRYFSLVDKLQAEVSELTEENARLKSQAQGRVIEKISEGNHSLQELIELQDHLKSSIKDSLESQLKKQLTDIIMVGSGVCELLLNINPDDDMKLRLNEYEDEYLRLSSLGDLADLISSYQSWMFRLVCKLGKVNESQVHASITNMKKSRTLKEARDNIVGKPSEFPLAAMDRTLSEIIKSYLAGMDERKGNIDSVIQKQGILARLLKEFKSF